MGQDTHTLEPLSQGQVWYKGIFFKVPMNLIGTETSNVKISL